jgi:hypothetical protein
MLSHSKGNRLLRLKRRVADITVGHMFLFWVQLKTVPDEAISLPYRAGVASKETWRRDRR